MYVCIHMLRRNHLIISDWRVLRHVDYMDLLYQCAALRKAVHTATIAKLYFNVKVSAKLQNNNAYLMVCESSGTLDFFKDLSLVIEIDEKSMIFQLCRPAKNPRTYPLFSYGFAHPYPRRFAVTARQLCGAKKAKMLKYSWRPRMRSGRNLVKVATMFLVGCQNWRMSVFACRPCRGANLSQVLQWSSGSATKSRCRETSRHHDASSRSDCLFDITNHYFWERSRYRSVNKKSTSD